MHFPLWLLFLPMGMCRASIPVFSPFFFMCTHHGAVEDGRRTTEVAMSLRIAGNPKHYVPGRHYEGETAVQVVVVLLVVMEKVNLVLVVM